MKTNRPDIWLFDLMEYQVNLYQLGDRSHQ